jgi:hypothetical protein
VKEDPNRQAVIAYLKKMEEIEGRRKEAVSDLLPGLTSLTVLRSMVGRTEPAPEGSRPRTDPSSLRYAEETFNDYRSRLQNIETQARAVKPPKPAFAFHQSYVKAAGDYARVVDDIAAAMNRMDASLGRRIGEFQRRAASPLQSADLELDQLLQRYDLERTFTVGD